MKTVRGSCNLRILYEKNPEGITVKRASSSDEEVFVPDNIEGVPITQIGDYAFSAEGPSCEEGEEILYLGKPDAGDFDNSKIKKVFIPETVRSFGSYVFYNCYSLGFVELYDTFDSWGGSVFINCLELHDFKLNMTEGPEITLFRIAHEIDAEFEAECIYPDGKRMVLLFPEYREMYEENAPARQFDYKIFGSGYGHHHSFNDRAFSPLDYDASWDGFLRMEDKPETAARIAVNRLMTPVGLTPKAKKQYEDYLRADPYPALRDSVRRRDMGAVSFLIKKTELSADILSRVCSFARDNKNTEALAVLMNAMGKGAAPRRSKTFDF